ncbi:MAG: hypothetical protein WCG97_00050 [bacterium]
MPDPLITNTYTVPSTSTNFNTSPTPIPPQKSSHRAVTFILTFLFILLVGGLTAFAYIQKIGPFALKTYSENNLLSSLLAKYGSINSSTYSVSGSLDVVARDADAVPFTLKDSNGPEFKKKYYYDHQRAVDVGAIVGALISTRNGSYNKKAQKSFPKDIKNILTSNQYPAYGASVTDPETNMDYKYTTTDAGQNFLLTVTFDTQGAINSIKRYNYSTTSTPINGLNVSFTKDSYSYIYLNEEPPKPFLAQMSDSMASFPADINVLLSVTASSQFKAPESTDWTFNVNAEGKFGDLTYKVNADALKKDKDYYFRINNIPSLFLFGDIAAIKGKWVDVSSQIASSSATSTDSYNYSPLSSLSKGIPDQEKKYKENRDKVVKLLKKITSLADEQGLISFKNPPKAEKVNGVPLVRYDLLVQKNKLLPFYTALQTEINTNPDFTDFRDVIDQGLVEYLKSDEFSQVYDYFSQNNQFTLWTDAEGYPAIFEDTMRVVPPEAATQLANKQINIVFKITNSDINKELNIQAPTDAVPGQKLIDDAKKTSDNLTSQSSTNVSLSSMRSTAELVYSKSENSYGKKPFTLGPCAETTDTLFGDKEIKYELEKATNNNVASATCVSTGKVGNVTAWAVSAPMSDDKDFSYCVDNSGSSKKILGTIKGALCK